MPETRKKLAIIDGKSVFYRGYYAMPNLSTKDGTPTGGVFGFAAMALEVLRKLKPDYVCVAWDKPKTNIRKRLKLYPEYKAGRKPAPPDFYDQVPILHELLEAFGWPLYELDDYEADDIMGTLAMQAKSKNIETLLITSDLDALQVVNSHTHVYAMKKGFSNIELFHPESFQAKYGIEPEQFLDLKALKGDSSDNIPGVPGVGEKTAIQLLKQYKTLDSVYKNLDQIPEKLRAKLQAGKDSAYLSKKLGAIWTDAPIKLDLSAVDGSKCDPKRVQEVLQKLEFRTLVRQLPEAMQLSADEQTTESSVFNNNHPVIVIDSDGDLQGINFGGSKELVIYSRARGKHGSDPQLIILSPSPKTTYALTVPKLEPHLLAKHIPKSKRLVGYDVKSSLKALIGLGIDLPSVRHDVQIGAFLINSLRREQSLTELAAADLDYHGGSLEDIATEDLAREAGRVSSVIWALYEKQQKELAKMEKVAKLAEEIEWPLLPVLAHMEYEGIRLDANYLNIYSRQLEDQISDLEQQIYGYADQEFNISSPTQLSEILFEKLKLPSSGVKRGKTGYSTAAVELDKLRGQHEIIDFISQYREVTKLKNTYVDTLPKIVDKNSRVHTTFNPTGSQTGRLSSNDPNLQNIPVRTELGKRIRTAFVAEPGKVLISADYSQFELRIAAYLCKDDNLIKMFNRDLDVHTATAAEIHNRQPEEVTKNMRRDAKVVNFGVMYGLSAHGLSIGTGMTREQAQHFIDRYFEVRPKLKGYIESIQKQAREKGYVENLFGRRRPTPDVHSSNFMVREGALRAAVNMPFQGSAADIMKLAMLKVADRLKSTNAKILLQIHDSLILECPEKEAKETAELVKKTMENAYKLPVKLTVDTSIGHNWGEL